MRDRDRARLLRVVDEVALRVAVGLLADDLDRVLVGADRAVGAEPVEQRRRHIVGLGAERRIPRQRQVRHVVDNADREVVLGLVLARCSSKTAFDHRRRELLRRQAVAAGDQARRHRERRDALGRRLGERRHDVEIERIARRARLLRAIEDGERADGLRQRGEERLRCERAIEPDLQHADLFAASGQVVDRLVHRLGARAHDHDDALGVRIADVLEQAVAAAGQRRERVHRPCHDVRDTTS